MSKRAEEAASRALPNYPPETYADKDEYIEVESERSMQRAFYQQGYEQAEKDLALTPEDVVVIINLYDYGKTRGWTLEDVLKRFNEQRKK